MCKLILYMATFLLSVNLFAQTTVLGKIKSNNNNAPVESASVYIDGSSIGTTSDKDGNFKLSRVTFPCVLVVGHISYQLKTIRLDNVPKTPFVIVLNEKAKGLDEVAVTGKSMREENVVKFKKYFLWGDRFVHMVKLLNPEILYFLKSADTTITPAGNLDFMAKALGKQAHWTKDSLSIIKYRSVFSTKTISQLFISIPKMGYKLSMDIDYFDVKTPIDKSENSTVYWSCYSHSIPIEAVSENEKAVFESNRRKAYFNSIRHFLRALCNNSLKENGFLIPEEIPPQRKPIYRTHYSSTGEPHDILTGWALPKYNNSFVDLSPYLVRKSDNEADIVGLKGRTFQILFFCKNDNEPINLNKYKTFQSKYFDQQNVSYITFEKDTCRVFSNGKGDDLIISGRMALSPIGSRILPDDYEPENNSNNTEHNEKAVNTESRRNKNSPKQTNQ